MQYNISSPAVGIQPTHQPRTQDRLTALAIVGELTLVLSLMVLSNSVNEGTMSYY